ncbi:TatD family hydrolase [Desulfogranum mediterraneum]|uniref:TatD family hydrolase n=1 Tax=Desulfogranum mediterraneum TaxID=160661 RepID=UPI00041FB040|nr:TatD family hydrolase [Desulfogranum mediterraneum]
MDQQPPSAGQLPPGIELIDTHCHLDMEAYHHDLETVLQAAAEAGVSRIITIGIDLESSRRAVSLAEQHPNIYASVGIHPHDAQGASAPVLNQLAQLALHPKVVAYGEIGLDYAKKYAPVPVQQAAFASQLRLARQLELPVIIHDRDAHQDTLHHLRQLSDFPAGGVMHCFSGDLDFARQVIELGFYLSIPGIVTFKNARDLHEVVREIDLRHLILETDGPFLAPVPFRGKRNTPDKVLHTARMVADLKQIPLSEVAQATSRNARALFQLPTETTRS